MRQKETIVDFKKILINRREWNKQKLKKEIREEKSSRFENVRFIVFDSDTEQRSDGFLCVRVRFFFCFIIASHELAAQL